MIGRIFTGVVQGIRYVPVSVEVTASDRSKERFVIVGLADAAIREAKERVISALQNCGFAIPKAVTVSLYPAEIKKEGSSLDLPIALSLLVATGQLRSDQCSHFSVFGELSLDGAIKKIRAPLAYVFGASQAGVSDLVIPESNRKELIQVDSVRIFSASHLSKLISQLRSNSLPPMALEEASRVHQEASNPFEGIVGQHRAKRALTVAAAGGHHLLMVGPPGCGKSLLASRLSKLLPALTEQEQRELLVVTSISGESIQTILQKIPPFRSPHHTVSEAGLVGGGSPPTAGEITLAHRGVLFLDEFPEFKRGALEALRAPLENGWVEIARVKGSERFPAQFQLIAAMNPCPCGHYGTEKCTCSISTVRKYLARISGPMLDRFDLQTALRAIPPSEVMQQVQGEQENKVIINSIHQARATQIQRQGCLNRDLSGRILLRDIGNQSSLRASLMKAELSMRGTIRVLRVARTLSDLDGEKEISLPHLKEAISFRALDKMKE